jgi:hypothetical protein
MATYCPFCGEKYADDTTESLTSSKRIMLNPTDRLIYDYCYMHFPYANIAKTLGIGIGEVRSRAGLMGINPTKDKITLEQAEQNLQAATKKNKKG